MLAVCDQFVKSCSVRDRPTPHRRRRRRRFVIHASARPPPPLRAQRRNSRWPRGPAALSWLGGGVALAASARPGPAERRIVHGCRRAKSRTTRPLRRLTRRDVFSSPRPLSRIKKQSPTWHHITSFRRRRRRRPADPVRCVDPRISNFSVACSSAANTQRCPNYSHYSIFLLINPLHLSPRIGQWRSYPKKSKGQPTLLSLGGLWLCLQWSSWSGNFA